MSEKFSKQANKNWIGRDESLNEGAESLTEGKIYSEAKRPTRSSN
jgi:hypothetical protein